MHACTVRRMVNCECGSRSPYAIFMGLNGLAREDKRGCTQWPRPKIPAEHQAIRLGNPPALTAIEPVGSRACANAGPCFCSEPV
jgi:hypothetical protein